MFTLKWETADTNEAIVPELLNQYHPVYLLRPHDSPIAITPDSKGLNYSKLCRWFFEANVKIEIIHPEEIQKSIARSLFLGHYYEDAGGNKFEIDKALGYIEPSITTLFGKHDAPQPQYNNLTPEKLVKAKIWRLRPGYKILPQGIRYPIKFSYNPNADYNTLPASKFYQ